MYSEIKFTNFFRIHFVEISSHLRFSAFFGENLTAAFVQNIYFA